MCTVCGDEILHTVFVSGELVVCRLPAVCREESAITALLVHIKLEVICRLPSIVFSSMTIQTMRA